MGLQDKFGRKSGLLAIMLSRSTVDVVRATGLGLYERVILIFRETWKGISVIIECSRGHFILVNLKQSLYLDERKKGRESVGKCVLKIVFFSPIPFFIPLFYPIDVFLYCKTSQKLTILSWNNSNSDFYLHCFMKPDLTRSPKASK